MSAPAVGVDIDFISPFSYLAVARLERREWVVRYRPVLFAAILDATGGRGPAEHPAQRLFSYRYCLWRAEQLGVPLRCPPAHPFNPLPALRLALMLDAAPEAVAAIFDFIWAGGRLPHGPAWSRFAAELLATAGRDPAAGPDQRVKERLRENTATAIAEGVFGVPCLHWSGELFFGQDGLDLLADCIADPALLQRADYRRLGELPAAAQRRP